MSAGVSGVKACTAAVITSLAFMLTIQRSLVDGVTYLGIVPRCLAQQLVPGGRVRLPYGGGVVRVHDRFRLFSGTDPLVSLRTPGALTVRVPDPRGAGGVGAGCSWQEAVAQARFGDEVPGVGGVGFEFPTQLREVHPQVVGLFR